MITYIKFNDEELLLLNISGISVITEIGSKSTYIVRYINDEIKYFTSDKYFNTFYEECKQKIRIFKLRTII
jgi:hypothetical protein